MEESLAITSSRTLSPDQAVPLQEGRLRSGSKERKVTVLTHIAVGTALPLIAPFILIANLISFCVHAGKFFFYAAKCSSFSSSKKVSSLQPSSDPASRASAAQQALQTLGDCMSEDEANRQRALQDLKDNCHTFVVSLLGMIPILGLLGAKAYAQKIEGEESRGYATAALLYRLSKPFLPAPELTRNSLLSWIKRVSRLPKFPKDQSDEARQLKEKVLGQSPIEPSPQFLYEKGPQIKTLQIPVDRGDGQYHTIRCHRADSPQVFKEGKTMVLFPGMFLEGTTLTEAAALYAKQGWNVVMVTLGGLYGSDPEVNTSEATAIQDVAAVLQYLDRQDVETIGVHGFSLGCALAMHATRLSSKVKVAVLDKPFTTLPETASHSVRNVAAHLRVSIENDEKLEKVRQEQKLWEQAIALVNRDYPHLAESLHTPEGAQRFRDTVKVKYLELKGLASHPFDPSQISRGKRLGVHALDSLLPRWVVRRAVEEGLPPRRSVPAVRDKEGHPYHTDNFDNKAKVAQFTGSLVVIGGEQDELMSYAQPGEERRRTCSDDLVEASPSSHCVHTQTAQDHFCFLTQEGEEAIQHGLDALVEPSSPPPAR